jgi:hypothetical protein
VQLIGWLVALGTVAYPPLLLRASLQYRGGNRDRRDFIRTVGLGSVGFSVLLGQVSSRWFESPVDDGFAVLSVCVLLVGIAAMYVGYIAEDGRGESTTLPD